MYQLFIANKNYSSWSLRPWVLMRELGIDFQEEFSVFESDSNWDAFREFSPSGTVPTLRDEGCVVWDSLAIVEYLAERHAGIWPEHDAARAWARCAVAEMHAGFSALRNICPMNIGVRVKMHSMPSALQKDIQRVDELWCEGLEKFDGDFLAGARFTAVDAFYVPVAFRVLTYGLPLSEQAKAYKKRLLSLASVQHWEQAALQEPWREAAHEEEARSVGAIIEDLRVS